MRRLFPFLLLASITLGVIAWGFRHELLEWWRFDRFGTHQPITEEDYLKLGGSTP